MSLVNSKRMNNILKGGHFMAMTTQSKTIMAETTEVTATAPISSLTPPIFTFYKAEEDETVSDFDCPVEEKAECESNFDWPVVPVSKLAYRRFEARKHSTRNLNIARAIGAGISTKSKRLTNTQAYYDIEFTTERAINKAAKIKRGKKRPSPKNFIYINEEETDFEDNPWIDFYLNPEMTKADFLIYCEVLDKPYWVLEEIRTLYSDALYSEDEINTLTFQDVINRLYMMDSSDNYYEERINFLFDYLF